MPIDFKRIKNLFVESLPEAQAQAADKTVQPAGLQENQPSIDKGTAGSYDPAIFDSLIKVVEKHNLPGEDYLEFLSAFQAMKNIQLDEKMKIQSVLATLSTRGLTPQKIKESAEYYKKVLSEEKKQFYVELGEHTNTQVKSKEKEITSLQAANKQKSEQIAQLTNEINQNQVKINDVQNAAKEADAKIKQAEANFNRTYDFIINQIDSNLSKIN